MNRLLYASVQYANNAEGCHRKTNPSRCLIDTESMELLELDENSILKSDAYKLLCALNVIKVKRVRVGIPKLHQISSTKKTPKKLILFQVPSF